MKTVFLLGWSVSMTMLVNAQSATIEAQQNLRVLTGNSTHRSFRSSDKTPQGSPNVFQEHLPGRVRITSGQELVCDRMNYDGHYDEVIVDKGGQEVTVKTDVVQSFYLIQNSDTLYFERLVRPDDKMGFYQLLVDGPEVRLYKKYVRHLERPASSGAFGVGKTVAEFIPDIKYFVRDGTLRLQEFKNRKSFLALFPDSEKQLSAFIREKGIHFQEEKELMILVTYLNRMRVEMKAK